MKVIIYGLGKIYNDYKEKIVARTDVKIVALCDKSIDEPYYDDNGLFVCNSESLETLEYDYIIVFSNKYYNEIVSELIVNYGVRYYEILSHHIFDKANYKPSIELLNYLARYIKENAIAEIYDYDKPYLYWLSNRFSTIEKNNYSFHMLEKTEINGIDFFYNENKKSNARECIKLLIISNTINIDKLMNDIEECSPHEMILVVPKSEIPNNGVIDNAVKFGMHLCGKRDFSIETIYFFIREKNIDNKLLDAKIYIVNHKKCNLIENDLYQPIQVGISKWTKDYIGEIDEIDNISQYNSRINECTALYWIWKHAQYKVVGLCHYRRYFSCGLVEGPYDYLDYGKIDEILVGNNYDIILPRKINIGISMYENIVGAVGEHYALAARKIIGELLINMDSSYYDAFEYVLENSILYRCNMFCASKLIIDDYCSWLFAFILKAADLLDVSTGTVKQKRTIGYYAEIMMTVWLMVNPLRIYELAIIDLSGSRLE